MNTSAEVVLKWGDGRYKFALKAKQIGELQRKCDAGLGLIVERVMRGHFYYADIYDTIRLGLIGGGNEKVDSVRALELVELYVDGKALAQPQGNGADGITGPGSALTVARAILQAAYFGMPELEEVLPKEAGAVSKKKTSG